MGLCDDALEANDVLVMKLSHDTRLGQEIASILLRRAALERLDRHCDPDTRGGGLQFALAHIAKLAATNNRLDFYVERCNLLCKLLYGNGWILVVVRVHVVELARRVLEYLTRGAGGGGRSGGG